MTYGGRVHVKRSVKKSKSKSRRSRCRSRKSTKKSWGGYSVKVTKLLLKSKDKRNREAARVTKTTDLKCPAGKIKRRAYFRKDKRSGKMIAVGAKCIKNRGKPGKAPRRILLGDKNALSRYGYEDVMSLTKTQREKALKEAVKAYGYVEVIRRVGALAALSTRTNPTLSKRFRTDQHKVSKWYNKAKKEGLPPTPR